MIQSPTWIWINGCHRGDESEEWLTLLNLDIKVGGTEVRTVLTGSQYLYSHINVSCKTKSNIYIPHTSYIYT